MQSRKVSDIYMAITIAAVAFAGQAYADSKALTDKSGMTVYTFDKDSAGKSACNGACAAAWPPVMADSMPAGAEVDVVTRDDGTRQAAYKGKPLYLFAGDRKPGDVNGDNVQNVWHAVGSDGKPAAKAARKEAESPYGSSYGY